MTESKLLKVAESERSVRRDSEGKINCIFLYNDKTNPQSSPEYWDDYLKKIKLLSSFHIK